MGSEVIQPSARHRRRLEEVLFLQHQPQGLGGEVHRPPSQPGRPGNLEFQVRPRAPIYGVVEGIIEQSGTPYFCFKDLDENKPSGSNPYPCGNHRLLLRRYREEIIKKRKAGEEIEAQLAALEEQLRGQYEQEAQGVAAD